MFGVFSTVSNTKTELSYFSFCARRVFDVDDKCSSQTPNLIYYYILYMRTYIVRVKTERKRQLILDTRDIEIVDKNGDDRKRKTKRLGCSFIVFFTPYFCLIFWRTCLIKFSTARDVVGIGTTLLLYYYRRYSCR